jgi:hypothetical protein
MILQPKKNKRNKNNQCKISTLQEIEIHEYHFTITVPVDVPRGDEERVPLAQKGPLRHVITPLVLSRVCDTELHCRGSGVGCVGVGKRERERDRDREREGCADNTEKK